MAETLFGGICPPLDHDHDIVWRWFHDERIRAAFPAAAGLALLRVIGQESFT
ncbi:hypothetical protein [Paractinoplanes atraurantiacus]|uniref:Uncharacterized protein n=1 Tax=Paractinoplanes atraurantiacus TaxID=1036182 RepID=A0A285GJZ3_9ACTN|nr:hypothetical protein [Actinoplanes atraurantiacus]SNY23940.1 hypothetical protein SAMN05421748_102116 [Actinoplanes atraurantiacus]